MTDTQPRSPGGFDAARAGSAPLILTYMLTGEITVETTVTGVQRDAVVITAKSGYLTLWSATLTQAMPSAKTTYGLTAAGTTIEPGAEFTLTLPTQLQDGNVSMQATIDAQGTKSPFSALVASWPLSSHVTRA